MKKAGIVSYGFYIPQYRIKIEDIATQWNKCGDKVEKSLAVHEKAVASKDEDILTMAYEASSMAFQGLENIKNEIGAVFIGSETFPYAVKPSSAALAEWLSLSNRYVAYDTQFACKAATGAIISAIGMVKSGDIQYGLVCGSDKANARPQDALEYSAGSGANAWIIGQENVILEVLGWSSYTSDTPDFWRRSKEDYPSHAGRFTGGPAYFRHITEASTDLMSKLNVKPTDCTYGVFHMPNGSFPLKVGKSLGFTQKQLEPSYVVPMLGNSYSASALMGLASTLDVANPGDTIFFASYGSGSGSDAIVFQVTDAIVKRRKAFKKSIEKKTYINYATYMRFMNIIS